MSKLGWCGLSSDCPLGLLPCMVLGSWLGLFLRRLFECWSCSAKVEAVWAIRFAGVVATICQTGRANRLGVPPRTLVASSSSFADAFLEMMRAGSPVGHNDGTLQFLLPLLPLLQHWLGLVISTSLPLHPVPICPAFALLSSLFRNGLNRDRFAQFFACLLHPAIPCVVLPPPGIALRVLDRGVSATPHFSAQVERL